MYLAVDMPSCAEVGWYSVDEDTLYHAIPEGGTEAADLVAIYDYAYAGFLAFNPRKENGNERGG